MANINDQTVFDMLSGAFTDSDKKSEERDALQIRKARIVKLMGTEDKPDNRIQVQVLGLNSGVKEEDKQFLPKFYPFYEGSFPVGDPGDIIWVVCTKDCQQGYYLGKASIFTSKEDLAKDSAINFNSFSSFMQGRKVSPSDFNFKDVAVDKCIMTSKGGILTCHNNKTGDWIVMNSTGAILIVSQKRIFMRVGSPNPAGDKSSFSTIELTTDQIEFKTPNFIVDSDNVVLGHHGMNLAMIGAGGTGVCMNNIPVLSADNIHV